jgi:transposase-like protein
LLQQLTKRTVEATLDGEITDHLGYGKGDPAGKNSGNSRNGRRSKTVLTEVGPVDIHLAAIAELAPAAARMWSARQAQPRG